MYLICCNEKKGSYRMERVCSSFFEMANFLFPVTATRCHADVEVKRGGCVNRGREAYKQETREIQNNPRRTPLR
jgi:hypothetical protein